MPLCVDAYSHALPENVRDAADKIGENINFSDLPQAFWDPDVRLADMDQYGIDKQVLTLSHPPMWRGLSETEAIHLARKANDGIHELAASAPNRFIPFATLPRLDEPFLDELDRCLSDLGFVGVQVFSTANGKPLDHKMYRPFWERVARDDVPVWIHPQSHEWHDWMGEFESKALGWPFDTSLVVLRLAQSKVFERYPNLTILAHHAGAMIPHFADRISEFVTMNDGDTESVVSHLKKFHVDTVLNGSIAALECSRSFYSSEKMLFATDYPFGPDSGHKRLDETKQAIEALNIDNESKYEIFSENLNSIIGK